MTPRPAPGPGRDAMYAGARSGLGMGAALLLVALVGMLEQFNRDDVIAGVLSLGQSLLLGGLGLAGFRAAQSVGPPDRPRGRSLVDALLLGAGAGALAASVLALLVAAGSAPGVNLRSMFVNASAALFTMLTFDREAGGLILLVGAGGAAGLAGAVLARIPAGARRSVQWSLVALLLTATLQDLLRVNLGRSNSLYVLLFARQGLSPAGAAWLVAAVGAAAAVLPALRAATGRSAAAQDIKRRGRWAWVALGALFLFYLPWLAGTYLTDVIDTVGIFILMGLGLNIVVGYAGMLDLGYVAFFAIGAYSVGALTSPNVGIGWNFWAALPVAIGLSILSGIILGIPVLKTHGDYLAIITLGFGEIIRILAQSDWLALQPNPPFNRLLGGAQGLQLIPLAINLPTLNIPFLGTVVPRFQQEMYFPIVVACAVGTYVAWRLRHSRYGRAWMAIREDEPVAEALGINRVQTKLFAFATGAALAGTSGALFASKLQSIFPNSFGLLISINVLVLIIVGGMGSLPGVFVGALVLVGLPELLREFSDYRLLLYGALLVLMMLKRPEGLWPSAITKRELAASSGAAPLPGASDPGRTS